MGCMLDSDWSRKILLRCDWLGPSGDPFTTNGYPAGVLPYMANTGMCLWTEHYQSTGYRQC